MADIEKMADDIFVAVEGYVTKSFAAFITKINALEKQISELPVPKNGKDADPDFIRAEVAKAVAAIPPAQPGKDADEDAVVAKVLANIRVPKDGEPGKDAEVDYTRIYAGVSDLIAQKLAELPKPKDFESIHPDTVALMVRETVDKAVASVRVPKDGEPGRDAAHMQILPAIDTEKSYPRGTWARHAGGLVMATRQTDPITETLAAAGWEVMLDGIADETENEIDDRTVERVTIYTSGKKMVRRYVSKAMIYRKVWREGEYRRGDTVTWSGSTWHCNETTTEKPGQSDGVWTLAVKHGRDGKDAAVEKAPGQVRLK